jgi:hypothetical protein
MRERQRAILVLFMALLHSDESDGSSGSNYVQLEAERTHPQLSGDGRFVTNVGEPPLTLRDVPAML